MPVYMHRRPILDFFNLCLIHPPFQTITMWCTLCAVRCVLCLVRSTCYGFVTWRCQGEVFAG